MNEQVNSNTTERKGAIRPESLFTRTLGATVLSSAIYQPKLPPYFAD